MSRAVRPRARQTVPAASLDKDGRERILTVAIRSFSELGYEGTTTAGIARDAGVTQPLVHHHFGSKEGLWRAAMDAVFANAARVVDVPAEASPRAQLLAITERFVRFAADNPAATRVMAREGAAPSPRLTYLIDRYLREPFQRVLDVTRAGQRAGLVAPSLRPDLLVFLVLGAGSHLFDVTALARESLGIDASAASTQDDFLALVRTLLEQGVSRQTANHRGAQEQR
jgi:AcrR family transcriptional regulator